MGLIGDVRVHWCGVFLCTYQQHRHLTSGLFPWLRMAVDVLQNCQNYIPNKCTSLSKKVQKFLQKCRSIKILLFVTINRGKWSIYITRKNAICCCYCQIWHFWPATIIAKYNYTWKRPIITHGNTWICQLVFKVSSFSSVLSSGTRKPSAFQITISVTKVSATCQWPWRRIAHCRRYLSTVCPGQRIALRCP